MDVIFFRVLVYQDLGRRKIKTIRLINNSKVF